MGLGNRTRRTRALHRYHLRQCRRARRADTHVCVHLACTPGRRARGVPACIRSACTRNAPHDGVQPPASAPASRDPAAAPRRPARRPARRSRSSRLPTAGPPPPPSHTARQAFNPQGCEQGQGIRCRVSRRERTHAGLAAKDAQFSGACNEPGFRPIGAPRAELRVLQRAHCARNSRVGAYAAALSRRECTRAGLAAKDAQFSGASNEPGFRPIGARGAEPRVLQRARGDRARILGTGRIRTLAQLRVFSADADYRQPEKVANIAQITTR